MKDAQILPLIVDLKGSFFCSSRDALDRAQVAKSNQPDLQEPTGLNIYSHRWSETQASLESIVFSFLTIEATINFLFIDLRNLNSRSTFDRWLHQKWKANLPIYDRFVLLVSQYSTANLDEYQYLVGLFSELIRFRNRIVHAHPEIYHALVERGSVDGQVLVHDVEPTFSHRAFPLSGLSEEIGRIGLDDARRGFEIMLLVVCFLDERFVANLEFPWIAQPGEEYLGPRHILESIEVRFYPTIDPESFIPEAILRLRKTQTDRAE